MISRVHSEPYLGILAIIQMTYCNLGRLAIIVKYEY